MSTTAIYCVGDSLECFPLKSLGKQDKRFTMSLLIHSFTHAVTHWWRWSCRARHQPAHQEQLGVKCLAQGHFNTWRARDRTANLGINGWPALPPEPQPPQNMNEWMNEWVYEWNILFEHTSNEILEKKPSLPYLKTTNCIYCHRGGRNLSFMYNVVSPFALMGLANATNSYVWQAQTWAMVSQ